MGQIAYLEADGATARGCTASPSSTCPTGFGCVMKYAYAIEKGEKMKASSAQQTRYQCCGQSFGCPYNSAGYIDVNTGRYKTCNLGVPGDCLAGYAVRPALPSPQKSAFALSV